LISAGTTVSSSVAVAPPSMERIAPESVPPDGWIARPVAPGGTRTLVIAAYGSLPIAQCLSAGIPVREVAADSAGLPDPAAALRLLYAEGVGSVLVEGGAKLLTRLLAEGLWDALTVFTAPLILGQGIEAVGDLGILSPGDGIRLQIPRLQAFEGFTRLDARNPASFADEPAPVKEGACLPD